MSEQTKKVDLRNERVVQQSALTKLARKWALQLGIVAVMVVVWLVFYIASPEVFSAPEIYKAFMQTTPFFAIIAIPATLVVIAKEIDLSFPSVMAWGMAILVLVQQVTGSYTIGIIFMFLGGLYAGLLNGLLVVNAAAGLIAIVLGLGAYIAIFVVTQNFLYALIGLLAAGAIALFLGSRVNLGIGVPSLVVTIGTSFLWRGVVLVVLDGKGAGMVDMKELPIYQFLVGRWPLVPLPAADADPTKIPLWQGIFSDVPAQVIWMVIAAVIIWIILNRTRFGAHTYLIGDNIDSARLLGVNVDATKIAVFCIVSVAAVFAGLLASLEVVYFWPSLGDGYLLNTLASVFLGGTSVFGGTGTVFGTFIAAFIIGSINAGIVASGLTGFYTQLIYGLIIVVSVAFQTIISHKLR